MGICRLALTCVAASMLFAQTVVSPRQFSGIERQTKGRGGTGIAPYQVRGVSLVLTNPTTITYTGFGRVVVFTGASGAGVAVILAHETPNFITLGAVTGTSPTGSGWAASAIDGWEDPDMQNVWKGQGMVFFP